MNNYTYSLGAITFEILLRFFIEKMVDTPFYTYVLTAEPMPIKQESCFQIPTKLKVLEASGGGRNAFILVYVQGQRYLDLMKKLRDIIPKLCNVRKAENYAIFSENYAM